MNRSSSWSAFASGFVSALFLAYSVACGGGGSSSGSTPAPPPPPSAPAATPTFADFFPHLQGKKGTATAIWRASGQVLTTYTFGPFYAQWGSSIERWAIAKCNGEDWAVVLAYEQAPGAKAGELGDQHGPAALAAGALAGKAAGIWEASSDQTLYDGQPVVCERGAAYAPIHMAPGTHVLKQWGQIAHERRYFWQTQFTLGGEQTNFCWESDGDKTRPVLRQSEVWQDEGGATARGTIIGDPWANNRFFEPQVVYSTYVYAALNAGTLWTGVDSAVGEYCLRSLTLT